MISPDNQLRLSSGIRRNRLRWIPLVLAAGFAFFFPDRAIPPESAILQFYGFAHFIFFALFAVWLSGVAGFSQKSFSRQIACITLLIVCAGGSIELIQPLFGRDAQWRDLGIDVLGGLFSMAFWVAARRQLRRSLLMGLQVAVAFAAVFVFYAPAVTLWDMGLAARQFPVLGDFETRLEINRWSSGSIAKGIARHGRHALMVDLGLDRNRKYQGTTLRRSFGDWRGYTALAFSIFIPDEQPLAVTVSIRDQAHFDRGGEYHDRFNRKFVLRPGWNDIAIPITDIEYAPAARELELDDLSEVAIFTVDPPAPRRMYLDYVRLIK